jgi:soluble cytochrome b562
MVEWKHLTDGFESLITKLQHDLDLMEQGNVRVSERTQDGWKDRTAKEMHDKRNLISTVQATLHVISTMAKL